MYTFIFKLYGLYVILFTASAEGIDQWPFQRQERKLPQQRGTPIR